MSLQQWTSLDTETRTWIFNIHSWNKYHQYWSKCSKELVVASYSAVHQSAYIIRIVTRLLSNIVRPTARRMRSLSLEFFFMVSDGSARKHHPEGISQKKALKVATRGNHVLLAGGRFHRQQGRYTWWCRVCSIRRRVRE